MADEKKTAPPDIEAEIERRVNERLAERLAAMPARSGRAGRETRDQESRENDDIHEKYPDIDFEMPGMLAAPPPRPGFVQRWMRTHIKGENDPANSMRKSAVGWKPRKADTAPTGSCPTVSYGSHGNVIGINGMILCERPEDLHKAHGRHVRSLTKAQQDAVDNDMFREDFGRGARSPHVEERNSRTIRGRRVDVADD